MLNPRQKEQVSRQIEAYEKHVGVGFRKINIGGKDFELEFDPFVANPDIMNSGIQVVDYLVQNSELVREKIVTDVGTGSGILGVTAALLGAKKVFMSDIDPRAVANAQKNVDHLKLSQVCQVFESDLFNNFKNKEKADVQIFNHPYFSETPVEGKDWTRMMLGGSDLIRKYFEQVQNYSAPGAICLMSWLTFAGNQNDIDNDPANRSKEFGFKIVNVTEQEPVKSGLQQAKFKIYELKFS